jgi:hypothetical protein
VKVCFDHTWIDGIDSNPIVCRVEKLSIEISGWANPLIAPIFKICV